MILKILRVFFGIALIIIFNTAEAYENETSSTKQFISVSDIHFTPFAGCGTLPKPCTLISQLRVNDYKQWDSIFEKYASKEVSPRYQDTNYALLKSTLSELKKINEKTNPHFVLYLGDFLAHDFHEQYVKYSRDKSREGYQAFVRKTLAYLTYQLSAVFPKTNVFPVVGNNDSYTGDYGVRPNGNFFSDTAATWSLLLKDQTNQENFRKTFPLDGFYGVVLPDSHHKIIFLNTVLFSSYLPKTPALKKAAIEELTWLHEQLVLASKQHQEVMLAFHIPVGVDVYATFKTRLGVIKDFWQQEYSKIFEDELKQFSNCVTAILCGHVHRDIYQLIAIKELADIPVTFTPSISPIFGNDPGFKVYDYDNTTFKINHVHTYSYPLKNNSHWTE